MVCILLEQTQDKQNIISEQHSLTDKEIREQA
jgi:hypothetical protein